MAKNQQSGAVLDAAEGSNYQLGGEQPEQHKPHFEEKKPLWLTRMVPKPDSSLAEFELWPRVFAADNQYEAMEMFKRHYSIISTEHSVHAERATEDQLAVQREFDKCGVRESRTSLESKFAAAAG